MNNALDDLMARVRKTNEKLKELGVSVDGAVPDYNEDGTANPIGDASYWRDRAEKAEAEAKRLREELTEIRDLARTGLPPEGMPFDYWAIYKSNRIAGMANAALKGGEE